MVVGNILYGGVLNSMIKFKLKNKPKNERIFFIFTKEAIEIHGTKISGKIIVK